MTDHDPRKLSPDDLPPFEATDEEWSALLRTPPTSSDGIAPTDAFRQALLERTRAEVRTRTPRGSGFPPRGFLHVAAALSIFFGGWFIGTQRASVSAPPPTPEGSAPEESTPSSLPADPSELERALENAPASRRRRVLADAGDQYLNTPFADPRAAIYCYRQSLADAAPGDLEIAPDDSWLLKALKVDRR